METQRRAASRGPAAARLRWIFREKAGPGASGWGAKTAQFGTGRCAKARWSKAPGELLAPSPQPHIPHTSTTGLNPPQNMSWPSKGIRSPILAMRGSFITLALTVSRCLCER